MNIFNSIQSETHFKRDLCLLMLALKPVNHCEIDFNRWNSKFFLFCGPATDFHFEDEAKMNFAEGIDSDNIHNNLDR